MLKQTHLEELEASIRAGQPGLGEAMARRMAKRILAETDERLEPNIREWLEGQPLSPIVIGDFSIPLILQIRGNRDFFGAVIAMNEYLADPVLGERRIWRTIR